MISEKNAKLYCKEDISLIENYEEAVNDNERKWDCHHRRESIYTAEGLIEIGEYYHRPAIELIFLTKSEHLSLHHKGKHLSEETKRKLSKANSGNNNPFFGKHHTEEYRKNKSKPILQYTKEGEFIKEWTSGIEASMVLGINNSNITQCCKGKRNYAGGFVWRYR